MSDEEYCPECGSHPEIKLALIRDKAELQAECRRLFHRNSELDHTCEDQARRIEELERHNGMMLDVIKELATRNRFIDYGKIDDALNATPSQSSAWLNKKHVEWMKSLPVEGYMEHSTLGDYLVYAKDHSRMQTALYAIPSEKE